MLACESVSLACGVRVGTWRFPALFVSGSEAPGSCISEGICNCWKMCIMLALLGRKSVA